MSNEGNSYTHYVIAVIGWTSPASMNAFVK